MHKKNNSIGVSFLKNDQKENMYDQELKQFFAVDT